MQKLQDAETVFQTMEETRLLPLTGKNPIGYPILLSPQIGATDSVAPLFTGSPWLLCAFLKMYNEPYSDEPCFDKDIEFDRRFPTNDNLPEWLQKFWYNFTCELEEESVAICPENNGCKHHGTRYFRVNPLENGRVEIVVTACYVADGMLTGVMNDKDISILVPLERESEQGGRLDYMWHLIYKGYVPLYFDSASPCNVFNS